MEVTVILLKIMLINLLLSGDNALLIAMASRKLPAAQRRLAIIWGTVGAVGLRIILMVAAIYLLQIPFLRALGAVLLLWIALRLFSENHEASKVDQNQVTLWGAIWTIVMADVVMSFDNVLALAVVSELQLSLMVIGVGLSIPIIIFGSKAVLWLMDRFTWVVWVGAGVLAYAAGEMLVKDPIILTWIIKIHPALIWMIPIVFLFIVLTWALDRRWFGQENIRYTPN